MSDWETNRGYSGAAFDQQVGRLEKSPLEKVKETFYTAKQAVRQKLGKKEDDHLVASDAELDAKLELYNSIKLSSGSLMRIANRYQKVMHELSKEEYALGQFLRRHGEQDPSRAGAMLSNVAKAFVISAQKRMEARAPLIRLAQDARTYRRCAVTDTERKIEQMEEARTEYRGSLLWMKKVSEELDPDTFRQLEKFRKVQTQVRTKKERFDSHKLDTLQKIDLLAISRLNMLSQSLTPYGTALHEFYDKTAAVLASVVIPGPESTDPEADFLRNTGQASSLPSTSEPSSKDDDTLLDLDHENVSRPVLSSSSEILEAFWKESGLETNNFDPRASTLDGFSLDSGDILDKKDSPDLQPPGVDMFNFSELDETEKGSMNFLSGEMLQPAKLSPSEPGGSKESPSGGIRSFLPSQLLKKGWNPTVSSPTSAKALPVGKEAKAKDKTGSSSWHNLFSDLDPLSGQPQAVKRTDGKEEEGSC